MEWPKGLGFRNLWRRWLLRPFTEPVTDTPPPLCHAYAGGQTLPYHLGRQRFNVFLSATNAVRSALHVYRLYISGEPTNHRQKIFEKKTVLNVSDIATICIAFALS